MAEILIKAIDAVNSDQEKDRIGCYKAGDIVIVMEDGHQWGAEERPPKFVIVNIPGVSVSKVLSYSSPWSRMIDFNVVAYNQAQDGYRLDVFTRTDLVRGSENAITKSLVESFLNKWGATIVAESSNNVRFDIGVYQAITSEAFCGASITGVIFTKVAYDSGTGAYRIKSDWSAKAWSQPAIESRIAQLGGIINSGSAGLTTFTILRDTVINAFKQSVKMAFQNIYRKRRYSISAKDLQAAINAGGVLTLTAEQAATRIVDKIAG